MCFESYEEAKHRCKTSQKAENEKRSPIGNFENMQWDKQALLEEVNSYSDGTVINWSAPARQYQVKNKNGELAKKRRTNHSGVPQVPRCGRFKI